MYKLKNFLFGWDYIYWINTADRGIARVIKLHDGRVVFWRYFSIKVMDEIKDPKKVFWLTCHPSKFFNKILFVNQPSGEKQSKKEICSNCQCTVEMVSLGAMCPVCKC